MIKRLEIVVVNDGRVVMQKVIPDGSPVALQFSRTMEETEIFEFSGKGYYVLRLVGGMMGKVAFGIGTPPQTVDVADALRRMRPGTTSVKLALDDTARGKIEIGHTVILFHFRMQNVTGLPDDEDALVAMREELMAERAQHCASHYPEEGHAAHLSYLSLDLFDWFLLKSGQDLQAIEQQLNQLRAAGRRVALSC